MDNQVLIGFNTFWRNPPGNLYGFSPVVNDKNYDCNYMYWTADIQTQLVNSATTPITVLIGTPGLTITFTPNIKVKDCLYDFKISGSGSSTQGSTIYAEKDGTVYLNIRTDDDTLDGQVLNWKHIIDNPDYKYFEVGVVDWKTVFYTYVRFQAVSPLLPPTAPVKSGIVSSASLYFDPTYISDLTWSVPRTFYKLTQVKYWTSGNQLTLNGFQLVYSCEQASFVSVGWTDFTKCFGTCYGIKQTMLIPIEKEITQISLCTDTTDFQMMIFKLNDGTVITPTGIDLTQCLDNTFYDLSGRLIGFRVKLSNMPFAGDGYINIRQIEPIVNTNDCITTQFAFQVPIPDQIYTRSDPAVTFNLPLVTNTVQTLFNDKVQCQIQINVYEDKKFFTFSSDFKQMTYYVTDIGAVGVNSFELTFSEKTRFTLGFMTGVDVQNTSTSVLRTNSYVKTTRMLPNAFMTNGNTLPYVSMVEAQTCGTGCNFQGMRVTWNNGKSTYSVSVGLPGGLPSTPTYDKKLTATKFSGFTVSHVLPSIIAPVPVPFYLYSIGLGGSILTGIDSSSPRSGNNDPYLVNGKFICGIIDYVDGTKILRGFDLIICKRTDLLSPMVYWNLTIKHCGALCLTFDPVKEYINQFHWSLYSMNGGETNTRDIWDGYQSSILKSNADNTNPLLVINFMKPLPVQGVWIQTDSSVMNSGAFDVRVANSIDLISPSAVCPGSTAQGIGVNSAGGTFNCGLTGQYFIINCYGGCKMAIQMLRIWPQKILSVGASVTLGSGQAIRAGFDTYKDLRYLVDTGSCTCLSTSSSINIDKGSSPNAAIMVDLGYSVKLSNYWLSHYASASTALIRIYIGQQPWTTAVKDTDSTIIIKMLDVNNVGNNSGQIQNPSVKSGRYVGIWRDATEQYLDVCKLLLFGSYCHDSPLIVDVKYNWPTITMVNFGQDVSAAGPAVDQGCVDPAQAGYTMTFIDGEYGQLLPWLQFDYTKNVIVANVTLKQFGQLNLRSIPVKVTLVPSLALRAPLGGFNMIVKFGDIKTNYCNKTRFIFNQQLPLFETTVRKKEATFFSLQEIPDQSSIDLGDDTGLYYCGPRVYKLMFDPPFLIQDAKNPLSFRLQANRFEDEGLQQVVLRVSLKDYPLAPALDVRITVSIGPCVTLDIEPKDPYSAPSNLYMVSYPGQRFPISRFAPNPLCKYDDIDFTYSISEQPGSLIPNWLTFNTKEDILALIATPDYSFNQNDYKLILTIFNEKLGFKIDQQFQLSVRLPQALVQVEAMLFKQTQTVEIAQPVQKQQPSEIDQLAQTTGVSSSWTGWMVLLEAKKKISSAKTNKFPIPPKASIESISNTGSVIIRFSKPMVMISDLSALFQSFPSTIPGRERMLIMDTIPKQHEMSAIPIPSQESDPNQLTFRYEAKFLDSNRIRIDLFFDNAPYVSSNFDADQLKVHLSSLLIDAEDGLSLLPENQTIIRTLPPQMKRDAATVAIKVASQTLQIASGGALASNAFMNIMLQGSLNQVWSVLNNIQMIVSTPLINVKYPGNAFNVFSVMITIATFDILPTDKFFPYFFPLPEEDEPFNENFDNLGFGSTYFVGNFGSALIGLLWLILMYIIYPLFFCCGRNPKRKWCKRKAESIRNDLFWNGTLLFVIEAYLDILTCCLINIASLYKPISSFGVALSAMLSILLLIACIAVPIFTVVYLRPRFKQLEDETIKERFGSIYEMINLEGHESAILWPIVFCIRRALFAIAVVFITDPVVQLMAFVYPTLAVVILLGLTQPLESPYANKIEMFDSVTVLILSYCLFCFTDFVPDANVRYNIGFVMIMMTCQNIGINIFLISREPFKKLIAKLKYWYKNPHRLKRKFTAKFIRKQMLKYLNQKKLEIKESLLIETQSEHSDQSEMEAISERAESEESEGFDAELLRAWNKKYDEQNPPTPRNQMASLSNTKAISKDAKTEEAEQERKKERNRRIKDVRKKFDRREQGIDLESSHEMTRTRLAQKAEKMSREGTRRKIRKIQLKVEPDASFLSDCDREVKTVVKRAKLDTITQGQFKHQSERKWHSRAESESHLVARRTNPATDDTPLAGFPQIMSNIPKLLVAERTQESAPTRPQLPYIWYQRQAQHAAESIQPPKTKNQTEDIRLYKRKRLINKAYSKLQRMEDEKAKLRDNIFNLSGSASPYEFASSLRTQRQPASSELTEDIQLIVATNRIMANARNKSEKKQL